VFASGGLRLCENCPLNMRKDAKRNMGFHPCNSVKSVSGLAPMPFGNSRDESQRDSAPKPRVASRELPWEKRVVSANPNGVVARWRRWDTTPLGLKIARTLTQGSLADSATLGWRTQSLWDCRAIGLSVVPYGTGLARNIRKALGLARLFLTLERRVRARGLQQRCALVGHVPSRGALLVFPSECEISASTRSIEREFDHYFRSCMSRALPKVHPTTLPGLASFRVFSGEKAMPT